MPTIWISSGEASGDLQAAALLKELQNYLPNIKAYGIGGTELSKAGQQNVFNIDTLSVLGIAESITAIPRILRMLKKIKVELATLRPDLVILVDCPDFNFQVAKIAHKLGLKICYFIPPKVWAWRTGRIKFLRKYMDAIISILPFEPNFYQTYDVTIDYVGNPLVDLVNWDLIKHIQPTKSYIGLMPGSRKKEVERLLPEFGRAAQQLVKTYPQLRFVCIRAPNIPEELLQSLWPSSVPLKIETPENRYATMRECEYILAASGTATLETALVGVPTIVTYRVSKLTAFIGHLVLKVKWVSLPNLILNREVFPEFLQDKAKGLILADALSYWIENPHEKDELQQCLDRIREECGNIGSADRAAQVLVQKFFST